MDNINETDLETREKNVKLMEKTIKREMLSDTAARKKKTRWPIKYRVKANAAAKLSNSILVIYLNRKGEIQQPMVVPIYNGNLIVIENHVHRLDPRALWTIKLGRKYYRCLIQRQIDRMAVSNLDVEEVRNHGDSTDSDELLITAALKAQMGASTKKPIPRGTIIGIGLIVLLAIIGFVVYSIISGGSAAV